MKKSILISSVLALVACLVFPAVSSAIAPDDFVNFYLVDSAGSKTQSLDEILSLSEPPHIYMELPVSTNYALTSSFFKLPGGTDFQYEETSDYDLETDHWATYADWSLLSPAQKLGEWEFKGSVFYPQTGASFNKSLTFNVVPEPIASILFLAGGVPFAVALKRRKRARA